MVEQHTAEQHMEKQHMTEQHMKEQHKAGKSMTEQHYEHVTHTFEPVFDEHSRILILGTFPSVKSRENRFYYGHPQNRFWKVLAGVIAPTRAGKDSRGDHCGSADGGGKESISVRTSHSNLGCDSRM